MAHPQTRILLSNDKEQAADNGATLRTLQSMRLSERSQSQISTYDTLHLHGVLENIKYRDRKTSMVTRSWGCGRDGRQQGHE